MKNNTADQSDRLWQILLKNIEWIKFSDTKATIILTVYGIIITLVYTNPNEVLASIEKSPLLTGLTILTGLMSVTAIYFTFKCLNPRLNNYNPTSLLYFGHIKQKFDTHQDYYKEFNQLITDEKEYGLQISEQILTTSQIAWRKFYDVSWAVRLLIGTIITLLAEILIYLAM